MCRPLRPEAGIAPGAGSFNGRHKHGWGGCVCSCCRRCDHWGWGDWLFDSVVPRTCGAVGELQRLKGTNLHALSNRRECSVQCGQVPRAILFQFRRVVVLACTLPTACDRAYEARLACRRGLLPLCVTVGCTFLRRASAIGMSHSTVNARTCVGACMPSLLHHDVA
jgi:hypothetical protein